MLTVLGGLAEFERELIKARTAEGRQRAKARGVRFGRKLKLSRHQIAEALARREAGEALTEIGRSYNVSHSTISRLSPRGRRQPVGNPGSLLALWGCGACVAFAFAFRYARALILHWIGALFYSWRGWPRTPLATLHPSECHWRYGET